MTLHQLGWTNVGIFDQNFVVTILAKAGMTDVAVFNKRFI